MLLFKVWDEYESRTKAPWTIAPPDKKPPHQRKAPPKKIPLQTKPSQSKYKALIAQGFTDINYVYSLVEI